VRHLGLVIWGLAIGGVVLDVFFSVLAGISPLQILGVTVAVLVICVLWLVRSLRIEFELRSRAGDPQLRADHNRLRERRGF
jgi:membrane protein implicated in regulation of membrane protease activity